MTTIPYNLAAILGGRYLPKSQADRDDFIKHLRMKYAAALREYSKFSNEYPWSMRMADRLRAKKQAKMQAKMDRLKKKLPKQPPLPPFNPPPPPTARKQRRPRRSETSRLRDEVARMHF